MKLLSLFAIASIAVSPCFALGGPVRVTYDNTYDNHDWPLSATACSDGDNGLEKTFPTLGDIPTFPFVGGIPGLTWNSPLCGTCWELAYVAPDGSTSYVTIVAVDESYTFNIAKAAFTALAGSEGVAAGAVSATAYQVPC